MNRSFLCAAATFAVLCSIGVGNAHANWLKNGVIVSARPGQQSASVAAPDGSGGAIIAWIDYASGQDVYAQRVDAHGNVLWAANGVPICTASLNQWNPSIVPDGSGGAIIAWEDDRTVGSNTDIYVQRVNASGNVLWSSNGVLICSASDKQQRPRMDATGAIVVMSWQDRRSGNYDVYAQRIDSNGTALWAANGVALCTAANDQEEPYIVNDGSGGAIVTWRDFRNGSNYDVYARAVNFLGTPVWTSNGVAVATGAGTQWNARIIQDGASGAIIVWDDRRSATTDIYAQRLNPAGTALWTANGVGVCTDGSADQSIPRIVPDGANGAITTWTDGRGEVYAQRLNNLGVPLWLYQGEPLTAVSGVQNDPILASDGAGGAVAAWRDFRNGSGDIYAQRIDGTGSDYWPANGVPVLTGSFTKNMDALVEDGKGGVLMSEWDDRSGDINLFTQRIELRHGWWGHPEPDILAVTDNPGDQGGQVALDWRASERDALLYQGISHYSTWRAVGPVPAANAVGMPDARAYGREVVLADVSADFAGDAYYVDRTTTGDYLWEFVGTQDAIYASGYSDLVSTRQDSIAGNPAQHYFQVVAHTFTPSIFFPSQSDSGYSVDNLAPAAPLMLTAQRSGGDVLLEWHRSGAGEPDFGIYAVYRAATTGVTPLPMFFIDDSIDTMLTDAGAPTSTLYYVVSAVDVHGNQSAPSNEAMVGAVPTGVGNTPRLTSLQVMPNLPNPFGGVTEIQVGLLADHEVSLEVFDVTGRRVLVREYGRLDAGWQRLIFDGRSTSGQRLPTGVYFYRVRAGVETVTNKMVLTR